MFKCTDSMNDTGSSNLPEMLDRCLFTGVIVVDERRRVTAISDEARILLGLRRGTDELPSFAELPAPVRELFDYNLSSNEAQPNVLIAIETASDELRPLRVTTTLMPGPRSEAAGLVAILHDLVPARVLEQKLRQMDRLASIGTLSASMAHEVKNALVAVKTFVDLLIAKNHDATLADIVRREMQRINSIVSQMLRFGGPARPSLGTIHLHQVIEQSLNVVQHHVEGRKITVIRGLDATPDAIPGDAFQMEQAFLNLFLNAIDAMGAQGELQVRTELLPAGHPDAPDSPRLRVIVRDNGIGVSEENLRRLFEPFFTTKPAGTGLGLPITRRIIEEHRGRIDVTSELHRGTQFTLLFPSAAPQP